MNPTFHSLTPMLQTTDMARTLAFYTGVLGFTVANASPVENPTWCVLQHGRVEIMFMSNNHLGSPAMTGTLYIQTTGVRAWHAALAGQVEVLWGPELYPYGMLEFAIKDCNGYTLSFGEPTTDAPSIAEEEPDQAA